VRSGEGEARCEEPKRETAKDERRTARGQSQPIGGESAENRRRIAGESAENRRVARARRRSALVAAQPPVDLIGARTRDQRVLYVRPSDSPLRELGVARPCSSSSTRFSPCPRVVSRVVSRVIRLPAALARNLIRPLAPARALSPPVDATAGRNAHYSSRPASRDLFRARAREQSEDGIGYRAIRFYVPAPNRSSLSSRARARSPSPPPPAVTPSLFLALFRTDDYVVRDCPIVTCGRS